MLSAKLFVDGMHITRSEKRFRRMGSLSRKGRNIVEAGYLLRQCRQLRTVQAISECPAAKDQVDVTMCNVMIEDVMSHRPERSYARSGTDQKKISPDRFRQSENSLGPPEGQLTSYLHFIEQIMRSGPSLQKDNDQLDDIGTVRPGCNRIAAPSLVGFVVNRQIQRDELPRLEVKGSKGRQLYPEPTRLRRLLLNADYRTCLPRLEHTENDYNLRTIILVWYVLPPWVIFITYIPEARFTASMVLL